MQQHVSCFRVWDRDGRERPSGIGRCTAVPVHTAEAAVFGGSGTCFVLGDLNWAENNCPKSPEVHNTLGLRFARCL